MQVAHSHRNARGIWPNQRAVPIILYFKMSDAPQRNGQRWSPHPRQSLASDG